MKTCKGYHGHYKISYYQHYYVILCKMRKGVENLDERMRGRSEEIQGEGIH